MFIYNKINLIMDYFEEEKENYTNLDKVAAVAATIEKPSTSQVFLGLVVFILFFILIIWVFQISWNASVPQIFSGANKITFTSALGLLIVAMILFR